MKKALLILAIFILAAIYFGYNSDSDVTADEKSYDVEYKVISTGNVSMINYLTQNGDTLTATNASANWSYKWASKGKSGDYTYLKITLQNTATLAVVQILANNSILTADSLQGSAIGTTSVAIGMSLPY